MLDLCLSLVITYSVQKNLLRSSKFLGQTVVSANYLFHVSADLDEKDDNVDEAKNLSFGALRFWF